MISIFKSKEHSDFYNDTIERLNADTNLKALIYTVGITSNTRNNWNRFYNENKREINPQVLYEPWQTGSSVVLTRLAFQLFTDNPTTAYSYDSNGQIKKRDFKECIKYSVSDIFCCELAPYFIEAVKIRYCWYFN